MGVGVIVGVGVGSGVAGRGVAVGRGVTVGSNVTAATGDDVAVAGSASGDVLGVMSCPQASNVNANRMSEYRFIIIPNYTTVSPQSEKSPEMF